MNKSGIRGSKNYIGTVHVKSANDMLELQSIRDTVKTINMEQRDAERYAYPDRLEGYQLPRFRVKCQGRGPRRKYAIADGKHPRAYDQSIPLSRAEKYDVYIYRV